MATEFYPENCALMFVVVNMIAENYFGLEAEQTRIYVQD